MIKKRRNLILAIGAGAFAAPFATFAQGKLWRIGYLGAGAPPTKTRPDANIDAFLLGLRELGYVEGKNLSIEWRFAQGAYERLPAMAAELVAMRPDLIVTYGTAAAQALHTATQTIPIVIAAAIDPVQMGFAMSFAQPGRNMTGLSAMVIDLSQKHLDLLRAMMPRLSRVALLVNAGNSGHVAVLKSVQTTAKTMNIAIVPVAVDTTATIDAAFANAKRERAGALIVAGDAVFAAAGAQFATASAKHRLACVSTYRDHVIAGTLMSYGPNIADFHRRAASYVDKILKGAKPGELPIEQPTTLELMINRKNARALGLTIPQSLLVSANTVIE